MVIIFIVEAFTYDHFENLGFGFLRIGSGLILDDQFWSFRDDLGMISAFLWPEIILDEIRVFPDNLVFLSFPHSYEEVFLHKLVHFKVLTKMYDFTSNWYI